MAKQEKKQINVEVPPAQKIRWEEQVSADPNAASLAHLIRLSVEHYITAQTEDDNSETVRELSSKLDEQSQTLQRDMGDIQDQIQQVTAEVREAKYPDLKRALYALLPIVSSREDASEKLSGMGDLPLDERVGWSGNVEDYAAWFRRDRATIVESLQQLRKSHDDVVMLRKETGKVTTPVPDVYYRVKDE